MGFDRGEDKRAIPPSSVALLARANEICRRATFCRVREADPGGTCDICRTQAEAQIRGEGKIRGIAKREGRWVRGDRVR